MRTKVAVWGIKGNWCKISLIPALNQISKDYNITEIFGIARNEVNSEEILNEILGTNNNLSEIFSTVKVGSDISEYENLKNTIDLKSDEQLIVYLSVPANSVPSIIESLGKTGFSLPNVKILIEKPFGSDLESAEKLFSELHQWFEEKNIYKVDHFMVKTLMQNIGSYKYVIDQWNNKTIKSIEVQTLENIDINGRANFYEETGCIRDMLQNHTFEMLLLTLCNTINNEVSERIELSSTFLPLKDSDVIKKQYIGYKQEVNNANSNVETFAKVTLHSSHPRWTGVNFTLVSGKAIAKKSTQIIIDLKDGSTICFDAGKNKVFKINSDQTAIEIKPRGNLSSIPDASKGDFAAAILGKKEFFVTKDEIVNSWKIFDHIIKNWNGKVESYEKGCEYEKLV